jgi:hypothetical protein
VSCQDSDCVDGTEATTCRSASFSDWSEIASDGVVLRVEEWASQHDDASFLLNNGVLKTDATMWRGCVDPNTVAKDVFVYTVTVRSSSPLNNLIVLTEKGCSDFYWVDDDDKIGFFPSQGVSECVSVLECHPKANSEFVCNTDADCILLLLDFRIEFFDIDVKVRTEGLFVNSPPSPSPSAPANQPPSAPVTEQSDLIFWIIIAGVAILGVLVVGGVIAVLLPLCTNENAGNFVNVIKTIGSLFGRGETKVVVAESSTSTNA